MQGPLEEQFHNWSGYTWVNKTLLLLLLWKIARLTANWIEMQKSVIYVSVNAPIMKLRDGKKIM